MYRCIAFALTALFVAPAAASAQSTPSPMTAAENTAVNDIAKTLNKRYPTPADAIKAGYVRYTNEDKTGAISYAGKNFDSTSEAQPAQLWYDVKGRLLGADYSELTASHPAARALFGISPARFFAEEAHIHYVLKNADGSLTYSRAVGFSKYAATGLDAMHPTAAGLVKLGTVTSPDQVAAVFLFPNIWDVTVWVLPNPAGAFADANPTVKPSKMPSSTDMQ